MILSRHYILPILLVLAGCVSTASDEVSDPIRLNQVGFYPNGPKVAVVVDASAGPFYVITPGGVDTVYAGTLGDASTWPASGEMVRQADFSPLREEGTYVLAVPGVGRSAAFEVKPGVHADVARKALHAYYFMRASTPLPELHAGAWARPAGHPDDSVLVHGSAASMGRPEGTVIASPGGWYDAGDYNKYVVNSGISTYTLLALYEHYPEESAELAVNIPETGDSVPDVLDEALWNIRWMLTMQDPADGGVYHKLTHAGFQGMVMPHEATAPRYVVQKSTSAALDFAAVAAQAARLYGTYPGAYPGLSDTLRTAALQAWRWARAHPEVAYDQRAINGSFDPDVTTGTYGDDRFEDEFAWAAAELYATTGADSFLTVASPLELTPTVPGWGNVGLLGWLTLLHHREQAGAAVDTAVLRQRYLSWAEELAARRRDAPYGIVMGGDVGDFVWGSSAVAANQGMALLEAYRLTQDSTFLDAALSNLDYLLGRNATGYSFVTGVGDHPPMHPHHRPSEADGVPEPVPGLLVGGPNPSRQDREQCGAYPSGLPARAYLDHLCSYASNEITINWNAPLVYLAAGIEAAMDEQ